MTHEEYLQEKYGFRVLISFSLLYFGITSFEISNFIDIGLLLALGTFSVYSMLRFTGIKRFKEDKILGDKE